MVYFYFRLLLSSSAPLSRWRPNRWLNTVIWIDLSVSFNNHPLENPRGGWIKFLPLGFSPTLRTSHTNLFLSDPWDVYVKEFSFYTRTCNACEDDPLDHMVERGTVKVLSLSQAHPISQVLFKLNILPSWPFSLLRLSVGSTLGVRRPAFQWEAAEPQSTKIAPRNWA